MSLWFVGLCYLVRSPESRSRFLIATGICFARGLYSPECSFLPHCIYAVLAMSEMSAPSVRPSVKHVICEKTKETYAKICIHYKRSFNLVSNKKNGWWGCAPSTWNFGANWSPLKRQRG